MLIDCDSCTARPRACGDCIVTHLLQVGPVRGSTEDSWPAAATGSSGSLSSDAQDRPATPVRQAPWDADGWDTDGSDVGDGPGSPELTDSEVAAVAVLAAGGLVPPLRLVTPERPAGPGAAGRGSPGRAAGRGARRTGTG